MGSPEARYRKLYPRIWRHKDFLPLDPIDKALVLYCLTGPQTNRVGFYVFSPGTAAEEVGVPLRSLQSRVAKICKIFEWHFDPKGRVLLIPSWWEWNKPENANVLKGALKDAAELPASTLWERWAEGSRNVCQTLGVTFPERIGQGSPIQEQEQEQEPIHTHTARATAAPAKPLGYKPRVDVAWPGRPPVPGALHAELIGKLGGDPNEADAALRAWYPTAAEPYADQPIGDDDFRFWRLRFREWVGTTVTPTSRTAAAPTPTYDPDWCQHDPRCNSRDWHDVVMARETPSDDPEEPTP